MNENTSPTRREFIKAASSLSVSEHGWPLCGCAESARAAQGRPNVLLVLTDQHRAQALGCMGNGDVHTPHIDRLAAEGVLLPNTFANTPLCTPARGNLLTGKFAHAHAVPINDLRMVELEAHPGRPFQPRGLSHGLYRQMAFGRRQAASGLHSSGIAAARLPVLGGE